MRRRPCAAFSRGQRRAAMVTEPKQKAPRKPKRRRKPLRSGHSKFCLRCLFRPPLAPSASCASRADPSRRGRWRRAGERREQECPLFDRIQNRPRFAGRLRKDVGRPQTGLSAATTHALAAPAKSSKNAAAKPTKPATHSLWPSPASPDARAAASPKRARKARLRGHRASFAPSRPIDPITSARVEFATPPKAR